MRILESDSIGVSEPRAGIRGKGQWWSRPFLAAAALVLLCLAVYGPGLAGIPVIDRDEARFAQASRQMAESGDWVIPRVQDRPRLNKPPLIYWLQASAALALTGGHPERDAIWMYRLPSALAATGSVLLTWWLTRRTSGSSVAFLAASLLALSPLVAFDAHQARADQLLLFCTTWAMASLWPCWHAARAGRRPPIPAALSFWLAVAAGVMTKGPITPLIAGLTIAALSYYGGSWRWVLGLRPALGLAILAAAVGPWVWAVAREVGFSSYLSLVWRESAGRAGGSSEGHIGPPGMHAVLLIALLWPGSLTTARGVLEALRRGWPRAGTPAPGTSWWRRAWSAIAHRGIGRPADAFLLAWALPGWVFFELFGAKLAHYPMPLYPAVAVLSARAAVRLAAGRGAPGPLDAAVWSAVGVLLALAVGTAAVLGEGSASPVAMAAAAMALTAALLAGLPNLARGYEARLRRGRWAMALILGAAFLAARAYIPGDESARITAALRTIPGWDTRPLASTHRQDSMVFHTRGRVERIEDAEAAAWASTHPGGLLVLRADLPIPDRWRVAARSADPAPGAGRGWVILEAAP